MNSTLEGKVPDAAPTVGSEIGKMHAEPLLPIEKKLVAYSLILGVVLLAILVWLNHAIFG